MHHRLLLLLLVFLLPHETLSGTTAAASCNRWCGGTNDPYPFGFSDGCPIALSCDANTSKPILPYTGDDGTSPYQYHVVSFNSTASSLLVSLPPSCTRSVSDVRRALSGRSYDVSLRTILLLRGGCRGRGSNAPAAGAGCGVVPASAVSRLLRTAQCGTNDTSTDVACVASAAPNATVARAVSRFWEKVEEQKCDDVLTSAVFKNTAEGTVSPEFKTAELGWWVNGTCAGGEGGGQCVPQTATCSDMETPSGVSGYRCVCMEGFYGDGYSAGDGCRIDRTWRIAGRPQHREPASGSEIEEAHGRSARRPRTDTPSSSRRRRRRKASAASLNEVWRPWMKGDQHVHKARTHTVMLKLS